MKIAGANRRSVEVRPMLTEVQEVLPTGRNKLKASFIQREKELQDNYVKDLEKSLRINKELISSLIAASDARAFKSAMQRLNEENQFQQTQIRTLKKQRDDYHAKWLIAQQIIEDFKTKEQAELAAHLGEIEELRQQLDEKEYAAQLAHHRFSRAEAMLKRHANKDKDICMFLMGLHGDLGDEHSHRISNVVEENRRLQSELGVAKFRLSVLEPSQPADRSTEAPNSDKS
ncbi:MAG: hypothetical protein P4M11_04450, partial [Candidatus Pacebacteria bacterium]|nr:hypothetical protein [Candidatus Paceibacterota bacterium]